MLDRDSIEAINVDQLVTATDRLLLTGLPRRRASSPNLARGSSPRIPVKPPAAQPRPALRVLARVAVIGIALGYVVTTAMTAL